MQKALKRWKTSALVLLFLIGAWIFVTPWVSELAAYQEDEDAYEAMALQIHPPDGSPEPIMPLPEQSETPEVPEQEATDEPVVDVAASPIPSPAAPVLITDQPATLSPMIPAEVTATPLPSEQPASASTETVTATPTRVPVVTPTATPSQSKPTAIPQTGIDLAACVAQNKDFVAWITIPDTKINYPVVRSDNTEYYLHHLFTGKESKLGSLFSLKSSDYQTPSRNIAIYGHHLSQSDAMFSTLVNYKDAAYCKKHSVIRLESLYGTREYKIFAVLNINVSDWDAATASFSSEKDFLHFVGRAQEKAFYDTGVSVSAGYNILTLITCDRSYGGASGRLIVMAVQQ